MNCEIIIKIQQIANQICQSENGNGYSTLLGIKYVKYINIICESALTA